MNSQTCEDYSSVAQCKSSLYTTAVGRCTHPFSYSQEILIDVCVVTVQSASGVCEVIIEGKFWRRRAEVSNAELCVWIGAGGRYVHTRLTVPE